MSVRRALVALTAANAAVHLAGLAAAWFWLRPGSPGADIAERRAHLVTHPVAWTLGWSAWIVAAIGFVAFLAVLRRVRPGRSLDVALALGTLAAAVDIATDALLLTFPTMTAGDPAPLFVIYDRAAALGGLVLANGLYSVAVLVAAWPMGGLARVLGAASFGSGALVALGGMGLGYPLVTLATGPTILLYLSWTAAAARDALRA